MLNLQKITISIVDVRIQDLQTSVWTDNAPISELVDGGVHVTDLFVTGSTSRMPTIKPNVLFRDERGRFVSWRDVANMNSLLDISDTPNSHTSNSENYQSIH